MLCERVHIEHSAIRLVKETGRHVVVPYDNNGEVKTAFITSKVDKILTKREVMWKR